MHSFIQIWRSFINSLINVVPLCVCGRVELQKMKIVRPPPDVARYTMVFHKRDSGNEINKDRSVHAETQIFLLWMHALLRLHTYINLHIVHAANCINLMDKFCFSTGCGCWDAHPKFGERTA